MANRLSWKQDYSVISLQPKLESFYQSEWSIFWSSGKYLWCLV